MKTSSLRQGTNSPGLFLHEPRTEQEVACLFGTLLADLRMVIERVQTPFPDCIVQRKDTGERRRVWGSSPRWFTTFSQETRLFSVQSLVRTWLQVFSELRT